MRIPNRIKLDDEVIDSLPFSRKGEQRLFWDVSLPNFGVRVTATSKALIVQMREGNNTVREVVRVWETKARGKLRDSGLTLEKARKQVHERISSHKKHQRWGWETNNAAKWEKKYKPQPAPQSSQLPPSAIATGDPKRDQLIHQLVGISRRMRLEELERLVGQAAKRV